MLVRSILILIITVGVVIGGIRVVPNAFHFSSNATPSSRGAVSEFSIPGSNNSLDGEITPGPDGNLWFLVSNNRDRYSWVGRITPAGVIATFPMSSKGSTPAGITSFSSLAGVTSGPDGNLWFGFTVDTIETINNSGKRTASICKIGQITPAGVITEFSLLGDEDAVDPFFSWPAMIPDPDGNLWFAERYFGFHKMSGLVSAINKIGRITPAGVITEFPMPNDDEAY